jgi:hypothetical protein
MSTQPGRTFVAVVLALIIAIGGSAWISDRSGAKDTVPVAAQSVSTAPQSLAESQPQAPAQQNESAAAVQSGYSEGYRVGYQDAQRDCSSSRTVARSRYSRTSTHATRRVAGARYYNEQHHGHSTRNMILTIAAPAAIGAGIGAIAGGGKGAGAGALIGGGAGALYHLWKHR